MKIAVLSDIHSNYIALEKCMEYALSRGIDRFFFLGDYVGEFAYPERTMKLLFAYREKYDCTFIRGNKEEYWIKQYREGGEGWKEYSSTSGALWYAYHHLTERDIEFFRDLPIACEVRTEGLPSLILCHGSPDNVKERLWKGTERTRKIMENAEAPFILCGHTHLQFEYFHQGVTLLNPGSVGLSHQAGGLSQFMILHGERGSWREEFITMDYDRQRAMEQLTESGLAERAPYWCRITEHQLRGIPPEIIHGEALERAMELCHEETGQRRWADLPEKYWDMALKELFCTKECQDNTAL